MKRKELNWNFILSLSLIISMMLQVSAQEYLSAAQPFQKEKEQLQKQQVDYSYKYVPASGRQGGEDIGSALPILAIPFNDVGNTCGNSDDYDEACPYQGSTAPDVVYSYTPATNVVVDIDLLGSSYDTKVFVYENTVGSPPFACNDDFYEDFVSKIEYLALSAGNTYYIIIDGYSGDCGNYTLSIDGFIPCFVCSACATDEGEPDIQDDELDVVNGGCFSIPAVFSPIALGEVYCGRANTYIRDDTLNYRDTDWYEIVLTQSTNLYWTVLADFDVTIFIMNGFCPFSTIVGGSANACEMAQVSANLSPGTYYLYLQPYGFTGLENGRPYLAVASDGPPPDPWCIPPAIPVSNWAIVIGILLIGAFMVVAYRRIA